MPHAYTPHLNQTGVKVQGIITSDQVPRKIYFSMNKRDPTVYDLYSLDLDTREVLLHAVNPGDVSSWLIDYDFNLRVSFCSCLFVWCVLTVVRCCLFVCLFVRVVVLVLVEVVWVGGCGCGCCCGQTAW